MFPLFFSGYFRVPKGRQVELAVNTLATAAVLNPEQAKQLKTLSDRGLSAPHRLPIALQPTAAIQNDPAKITTLAGGDLVINSGNDRVTQADSALMRLFHTSGVQFNFAPGGAIPKGKPSDEKSDHFLIAAWPGGNRSQALETLKTLVRWGIPKTDLDALRRTAGGVDHTTVQRDVKGSKGGQKLTFTVSEDELCVKTKHNRSYRQPDPQIFEALQQAGVLFRYYS